MVQTIDAAYYQYKKDLFKGEKIVDERGDVMYSLPFYTIKFSNHILNVNGIKSVLYPGCTDLNQDGLKIYADQLLDKKNNGFIYTYGNRLRDYFGKTDQLKIIIDRINKEKNTRRAIAITYDPVVDSIEDEIPCLIMVKAMVFDGKLDLGVVFRSNDIKIAFPANMYGLFNLHLFLSEKTNLPIGDFYYTCFNPHWKVE